jgi:hypothetical protein
LDIFGSPVTVSVNKLKGAAARKARSTSLREKIDCRDRWSMGVIRSCAASYCG